MVLLLEAGGDNTKQAMHFVNGAGQLWAVDTNTSVQPDQISGRTMAPTILVAERTAHDILTTDENYPYAIAKESSHDKEAR